MEEPERITVRDLDADKQPWESYVAEALAAGQAAMGYILRDPQEHAKDWPQADVYVCYRQGDAIILIVPKDTPLTMLPKYAMCYWALAWENVRTGEVWSGIENKRLYKRLDPSSGMETYFNTPE